MAGALVGLGRHTCQLELQQAWIAYAVQGEELEVAVAAVTAAAAAAWACQVH